jgi:hypothetical protein
MMGIPGTPCLMIGIPGTPKFLIGIPGRVCVHWTLGSGETLWREPYVYLAPRAIRVDVCSCSI